MDDGLTLLDERRGMIYHLNHTGAAALSALLGSGVEAAVTALCARYAVTAETARRDITRLLDELLAHRLVVRQ
ncbi:MAG: PqqD family peptide modification chaperone [Pseudonocardiaceae bacterium]